MDFPASKFEIKTVVTKEFFNNVGDLIYGGYIRNTSFTRDRWNNWLRGFCNKKKRENNNLILAFTHNLFSFDFFFVVKGIRFCVWRTKQLNIGGTNVTNVQYANIGNQVKFIDTMKYHQQSRSSLAKMLVELKRKT